MASEPIHKTSCTEIEATLLEYLDGRAGPAERRRLEEHLSACAACRTRAEEFRVISDWLEDLPEISPSPVFDARLRVRIAAEPARISFWRWLPSPRLAFATAALIALSVWLSSMPGVVMDRSAVAQQAVHAEIEHKIPAAADADFRMIRDLPVLENYDVLSKFDALSELPEPPLNAAPQGERIAR